jgi:hypothetical protein
MSGKRTRLSASPQTSPITSAGTSPYQTGLRGGGDRQAENRVLASTGIPHSNGETMEQQQQQQQQQQSLPLRTLGVHNILNPVASGWAEGNGSSPKASSSASNSSPHGPQSLVFPGAGMVRHGQTTPTTEGPPSTAPPSAECYSPGAVRPFPVIATSRRVLAARSPRLTSTGQNTSFRTLNPPQPQHLIAGPHDSSRVLSPEAGVPGPPDQSHSVRGSPLAQHFSRVGSPADRPPPNITPLATPTRSTSQPVPSHPSPNLQGGPYYTPGGPGGQPGQPPGYQPHNPYPTVVPQTHSGYPGPGGDPRWLWGNENAFPYGPTGVRSFAFGEGQAALRIQPAHGEGFIVPVDTHQGSRQADEKRQRNAGASARFRKRKKDRETQERMDHQRMENQYRGLESRIQALEDERVRLRTDRNRLRDIVYRTPTVSELAYQGPPSPDPLPALPLPPPPSMPRATTYGSVDSESDERPSQRRRTDPHPQVDFSNSPYASATPGSSLPPIPASGYSTSISHPGTPSTRHQQPQLPPLRLGSGAGTPTTAMSAASTPVHSYPQLKSESPYETGWATGPRGTADR